MDTNKRKAWDRQYYERNRPVILEKSRQSYLLNRDDVLEGRKKTCPICSKVFSSTSSLKIHHMSSKHKVSLDERAHI